MSIDELNCYDFVARLKAGDNQAFVDFVERYSPRLCSILKSELNLCHEDAEDIALEALLKAHDSIDRFDISGKAKFTTWVTKIAVNAGIDFTRKKKIGFQEKAKVMAADSANSELRSLFDIQSRIEWFRGQHSHSAGNPSRIVEGIDVVNKILDSFNEKDRDILRLRTIFTYEEIAQNCDEPVGRLRTRYNRAFERLRSEMEKEMKI